MVRASTRPDGVTAPIASGFSSQERMNLTSSSRRRLFFSARDCKRMEVTKFEQPGKAADVHRYKAGALGSRYSQEVRAPSPSNSSFTFVKKPTDSGWVSFEDSFSNSASNSRCRRSE